MPDDTSSPLARFADEKVVLLQTRKRDGTWVDTPVNIAVQGNVAFFRTYAKASKNKRLRNFADVRFRPCTWRGKPTGPPVEATARLLSADESAGAAALIERKYQLLQGFFVPLSHRAMRTKTLHYELTDVRELAE